MDWKVLLRSNVTKMCLKKYNIKIIDFSFRFFETA